MLVLTRRKQESVMLGQDIVITVLEIRGDQVRLGITAPRDLPVYREELLTSQPADDSAAPDQPVTPAPPTAGA